MEGDEGQAGFYFFLEIATMIMPSIAMLIAGATVSRVVLDKNSHTASAMQMSPTISLSFLTYFTQPPETRVDISQCRFFLLGCLL